MLAGVLFVVWGYFHGLDSSSAPQEAVAKVLGFVVPLLFLAGAAAFCVWSRERLGWVESVGLVFCSLGAGLGFLYRVLDASGVVDAAARYAYLAGKGLPPFLFDWFPCLLLGLTLVGLAHLDATTSQDYRWLPLATGLSGWLYHFSDVNGFIEARWAHVLFGILFGCGWVMLGGMIRTNKSGRCSDDPGG